MMWAIDRFGHDASNLLIEAHYAIGYQSRWSVPEEVGERQPLRSANGHWFVFLGRIDNRSHLAARLGLSESAELSDAALLLRFIDSLGQERLSEVIGPYVFVRYDPQDDVIVAARDGMGGRYLCYAVTDEQIVLSTYELSIVASGAVPYNINDEKAARILMNEMEAQPSSTIQGISPLNPGQMLIATGDLLELERFYTPDPERRITMENDEAYAREFRRLLDQAVKRRLRSIGPIGTMLSGGLDSVPMTISAAKQSDESLNAFSWVFDEYPEQDERQYSAPVCASQGVTHNLINCDHIWPRFDEDTYTNPVFPFGIPYSEFQQETFRRAQTTGVKTILTGIHGDLLYGYTESILYELLKAGRLSDAIREARVLWGEASSIKAFIKHYLIKPLPGVISFLNWRNRKRTYPTDCLQDNIAALIKNRPHWLEDESRGALRSQQWRVVLDGFAGEDMALGRYMEAKFGIERRYPFRDRELCEFMLAIPSDQLYFNLTTRPIVKHAFESELPPEIQNRNNKTNFGPRIEAGIKIDKINQNWFNAEQPRWTRYVKECYFQTNCEQKQELNVIRWRCGYYDYWNAVCYNPVSSELGYINGETQ